MAIITPTGIITTILNVVAESLLIPVLILLLVFLLLVLIQIGSLIAEYSNRSKISQKELDGIINNIANTNSADQIAYIINHSNINQQYKDMLVKIANTAHLGKNTRESYVREIIEDQEYTLAQTVRKTDIISRVSSGCGLLGTLIPLGPGLASLGSGDVATLSAQLIIAFNTTTVGLSISLVSYVISKLRKSWYKKDIGLIYTISDAIMEVEYAKKE